MCVSGFSSLASGEGMVFSDVTSFLETCSCVCDPQMPVNHCRADCVTSWLRPGLLCSKVNYTS